MCGIIGITKSIQNGAIGHEVYDALTRLEYRGYDSVGIAVLGEDSIQVEKDKGAIKEVGKLLEFRKIRGSTAIGHSRWATHGPPSKINAHPHQSMNGDVVVVHNGIIENFIELRKELEEMGYNFISQTDTEIIPHYLSNQLKSGKSMIEAIIALSKAIKGTYAIVASHVGESNRLYAIRKDNPLVLGISSGGMYCASDIPAFLPWTNKIIILKDNELAILDPDKYQIINLLSGQKINRKPHSVTWNAEAAQKGGFPHHMLKEIHEQSRVLGNQLSTQEDVFDILGTTMANADKVILVAAGTAHYASLNAYYTFPKYGGPLVIPCVAAEWDSVKPLVDENTIVLAVSQSGETLDTMKAVKDAKQKGARISSIVNVTGSSLTSISDDVVYIHAGPEIGVAATKTYSAQSLAIWRIARSIAAYTGVLNNDELAEFDRAINGLSKTVNLLVRNNEAKARDLSKWFSRKTSAFYLGRGISYSTALEGALKMKEISYIHAEAYPAGESKHGPIALVENDYPVVFTIPQDGQRAKMMGSVQEMSARGATTIGIVEKGDQEMINTLTHSFIVPNGYSNYLSPIAYQIPQQLLAYYTATNRGYNPDRPRNLAKSVTVE
ncbi:MAG: glutamine--fructose-6-phosphate transaminase (isomerizing) [Candidatus Kariarchaeaceae archaeon]|jgi:glucosamine--fructose-6-phosphate aminotransferase (isomerizing)